MVKTKKEKKKKGNYYIHLEPIVFCLHCGFEHLRRQRNKVPAPEGSGLLTVLVCPKCDREGYVLIGDHRVRRIIKNED